jgi:type III secretory pathway component EscT
MNDPMVVGLLIGFFAGILFFVLLGAAGFKD